MTISNCSRDSSCQLSDRKFVGDIAIKKLELKPTSCFRYRGSNIRVAKSQRETDTVLWAVLNGNIYAYLFMKRFNIVVQNVCVRCEHILMKLKIYHFFVAFSQHRVLSIFSCIFCVLNLNSVKSSNFRSVPIVEDIQ